MNMFWTAKGTDGAHVPGNGRYGCIMPALKLQRVGQQATGVIESAWTGSTFLSPSSNMATHTELTPFTRKNGATAISI